MSRVSMKNEPALGQAKGIASVETAARLLHILEAGTDSMSLTEIAGSAGFPASKAHHYLVSLTRTGLVERDKSGTRYRLGSFALQLGLTALNRMQTHRFIPDALRSLRDKIGHTTLFATWSPLGPMVTDYEECVGGLGVSVRPGTVLPMVNSPCAAVFIAWLPDSLLAQGIERVADPRLTPSRLVKIREQTRREGGAHAAGVRSPQIASVAAPVFGRNRQLVGALVTLGLVGQFDDSPSSEVSVPLRAQAGQLSATLTGLGLP